VRLHPQPHQTVTAVGRANDPEVVARGASELAHASLEKECVDVRWQNGSGAAMARLGGVTAGPQAQAAARLLRDAGLETELVEDDFELWARQRDSQRSADRAVVRVSGLQTELARTMRAAESLGGSLVGRASLGISWITIDPQRIAELRGIALDAMRALERFNPYLTGPVLKGIAGPYAEIELQLFPDSVKEVEIFLLDRNLVYDTRESRRFAGDRAHAVSVLTLTWDGAPLRLSIFDPRDERVALKSSQAGRVMDRAGIAEVGALVRNEPRQA
jgi:hypothetical protein